MPRGQGGSVLFLAPWVFPFFPAIFTLEKNPLSHLFLGEVVKNADEK